MKVDTSLRTVEPLAAIRKHPVAATFGGAVTAIVFGIMGATIESGADRRVDGGGGGHRRRARRRARRRSGRTKAQKGAHGARWLFYLRAA